MVKVTAEKMLPASADVSRESPSDRLPQPRALQMTQPASAANGVHYRETEYGTGDGKDRVDRFSGQ